jgi:acyl-CoA synthetase (NDP forming)
VPVIYGTEEAVAAAQAVIRYAQAPPVAPAKVPTSPRAGAIELLGAAADEAGAKRLLACYGLPVTRERACRDIAEAIEAAAEIGYPVAVKVLSADLPHKTEFGGVRLDVQGPAALEDAIITMTAAVRQRLPDVRIAGYLVQEMICGQVAELILGIHRDPHYGPVVLCGMGGVYAEVLSDTALRLAPVTDAEALAMVKELRGFPLLAGARGRPAGDLPALTQAICRLSELAAELGDRLKALDINPVSVLANGHGVRVVDAMVFAA